MTYPGLQAGEASDIGEVCGIELEAQMAAAVEQFELELVQFGQVVVTDRAVAKNQMTGDAPCVGQVEAAQIAHQCAQGVGVHLYPLAGVFAGIDLRFIAHQFEQRVFRSEEHTSELQSLMRISYA